MQLILEPQNPRDPPAASVAGLADMLENALPDVRVELGVRPPPPPGTASVTWYEVLYLWMQQEMPPATIAALLVELGHWCVKRHRENGRPQHAGILGPDGRVIRWVRVEPDGALMQGSPAAGEIEFPMGHKPPTEVLGRTKARLLRVRRRLERVRSRLIRRRR